MLSYTPYRSYKVLANNQRLYPLQKQLRKQDYETLLTESQTLILFAHKQWTHDDWLHFRQQLRPLGYRVRNLHNSIFKLVEQSNPWTPSILKGPHALIYSFEKETNPSNFLKLLKFFPKEKTLLRKAKLQNEIFTSKEFRHFATLPSQPQLQFELVSLLEQVRGLSLTQTLERPAQSLVSMLNQRCSQETQSL